MIVRVSIGSLARLGIENIALIDVPTTLYVLQYAPNGCIARCAFCSQSHRNSSSREYLARVMWPAVELEVLEKHWKHVFVRICIQNVLKRMFVEELMALLKFFERFSTPLSLCTTPLPSKVLEDLAKYIDCLGIGLDAASPTIFESVEKPFTWSTYIRFIENGVRMLGKAKVWVHVVAGLGEDLRDVVKLAKRLTKLGAYIALFNYVAPPKSERRFPGIKVEHYRLLQIALKLLDEGYDPEHYIDFDRLIVKRALPIDPLEAVYTRGCPGCNRPFYNESPRGPIYNFSSRSLLEKHIKEVEQELQAVNAL